MEKPKLSLRSALLSLSLLLSTFIAPLTALTQKAAAAGSLYISPGSKTVQQGVDFTVQVRANGATADAVQVTLNYPADQLDYVANSLGGSATPFQAVFNVGGGVYSLAATVSPGNPAFSGDALISTITFRPKLASGSGSITFAGDSALVNNGSTIGGGGSGITLGYTAKPAAAPPKSGGSSAPAAPPADKTAPIISELAASSPSPKEVNITWKTDEASSSVVEFGLDDKLGLGATADGSTLEHTVALNPNYIEPGLAIYYRAKSADAAGNVMTSDIQQYVVPGVSITLTVKNTKGKPVSDATVKFNGEEKQTDKDGRVTFDNVPVGTQSFEIKKGKTTKVASVEVGTADTAQSQDIEFDAKSSLFDTTYILAVLAILLVVGLLLLFLKKRGGTGGSGGGSAPWKKEDKPVTPSTPDSSSSSEAHMQSTEIGKVFSPEDK